MAAMKPSRQTILRLPEDLASRIDGLADKAGASRNAVLVAALTHALSGDLSWVGGVRDGRTTRWDSRTVERPG